MFTLDSGAFTFILMSTARAAYLHLEPEPKELTVEQWGGKCFEVRYYIAKNVVLTFPFGVKLTMSNLYVQEENVQKTINSNFLGVGPLQ